MITHKGECLKILKTFKPNSIDLTLTSPPYNLGSRHHTGADYHSPYKDDFPESEYQEQQINVLNEIYRVTKESGSILYNHKNRIRNGVQITPYEWILKSKWTVKQEIVWFNGSQNFDKIRFYPMTERVYWLAKSPKTKLFNTINHHDFFSKEEWGSVGTKNKHTRAFPEKMAIDLIKCFESANVILDPYMGSGTTGVACKVLKKNFVGIEINEEYLELSKKRINNAYIQEEL